MVDMGWADVYLVALLHEAVNVVVVFDLDLLQALDVDAVLCALADLEVDWRVRARAQQVADMLVVHFEVRDLDVVGRVWLRVVLDAIEQLLTRARDQPGVVWRAHHGVALPGARLAVREDACVVAAEVVVEELFAKRLVDVLLMGVVRIGLVVRPERAVECELPVFVGSLALVLGVQFGSVQFRRLGRGVHADQAFGALVLLCDVLALAPGWARRVPDVPRFKKVLHRTTTLMLPESSCAGGAMAAYAYGSAADARSEGAEAVVAWNGEYIRGSRSASSSR